jgi:hypothetical protein
MHVLYHLSLFVCRHRISFPFLQDSYRDDHSTKDLQEEESEEVRRKIAASVIAKAVRRRASIQTEYPSRPHATVGPTKKVASVVVSAAPSPAALSVASDVAVAPVDSIFDDADDDDIGDDGYENFDADEDKPTKKRNDAVRVALPAEKKSKSPSAPKSVEQNETRRANPQPTNARNEIAPKAAQEDDNQVIETPRRPSGAPSQNPRPPAGPRPVPRYLQPTATATRKTKPENTPAAAAPRPSRPSITTPVPFAAARPKAAKQQAPDDAGIAAGKGQGKDRDNARTGKDSKPRLLSQLKSLKQGNEVCANACVCV